MPSCESTYDQLLDVLHDLKADMSSFSTELTRLGGPIDRIDRRLHRLERAQNAEPINVRLANGAIAAIGGALQPVNVPAGGGSAVGATTWRVRSVPERERKLQDIKVRAPSSRRGRSHRAAAAAEPAAVSLHAMRHGSPGLQGGGKFQLV